MEREHVLLRALVERGVRFAVIGVRGVNLHAVDVDQLFSTLDWDLFLPPEPENLIGAWEACDESGLDLVCESEPLVRPRDGILARAIVERRALTRATDHRDLLVDLSLVMAGFTFDVVWAERRRFRLAGVEVPVARLTHIVRSKAAAGRPKDRLFLTTHQEMLTELMRKYGDRGSDEDP